MALQSNSLAFTVSGRTLEELLGFDLPGSLDIDIFKAQFSEASGQFQNAAVSASYYYDFVAGLELQLKRPTLGVIDIDYPITAELELPDFVSGGEVFTIGTTDNFSVTGATAKGESLNYGELALNFVFQSGGAGISDLSFGNLFGTSLLSLEDDLVFDPIPKTTANLITVSLDSGTEVELLDGVEFEAKPPTGDEEASAPVSGSPGKLVPISVEVEDTLIGVSVNPFEVLDDVGFLRLLDVLTEDYGPAQFSFLGSDYEAELEYTLAAPSIQGGYALIQTFAFKPTSLETSISVNGQTFSGRIGDAFEFIAPDVLSEPLSGEITYRLGGNVEVSYALAPTGSLELEILSAEGSIEKSQGAAVNVEIGPFVERSISGSAETGMIKLFDPIVFALPETFFEPVVKSFTITPQSNSLSFIKDFVVGTTQDTSISFDLKREGDLSFPVTVFVDGEITNGADAVFNDFSFTFPKGTANPELLLAARVSNVKGDVAYALDISIAGSDPSSKSVVIKDGTAAGILIGDEVDDRGGSVFGDPHLITFDNLLFDFQAAGDFVLARAKAGNLYEVQVRFVPLSSAISVTNAMATSVQGKVITLECNDGSGRLNIDGQAVSLVSGGLISLGTGSIKRSGQRYTIDHGNGDSTVVDVFARFMNVTPSPSILRPKGEIEGLLGNANGTPADDFQLADGTVLTTPLSAETLYGDYAKSWQVSSSNSILPGNAQPFLAPGRVLTIDRLPEVLRKNAERVVDEAGITNPILRAAAILDFALTGNSDFVESAVQTNKTFNPIVDSKALDVVAQSVVILTADRNLLTEGSSESNRVLLTVARGSSSGDLAVSYRVQGVATSEADAADFVVSNLSGELIIPDGKDVATFGLEVFADQLPEDVESFDVIIALDESKASEYELLVSSVRISIVDSKINRSPLISVPAADVTFAENQGAFVLDVDATDPENDAITFALAGLDADRFQINQEGKIEFRQSPDFESPSDVNLDNRYDIQVIASDPDGNSAFSDLTVLVADVNEAPLASRDVFSFVLRDEQLSVSISPLLNDVDPDADALVLVSASDGRNGVVTSDGTTLTYTRQPGFAGVDSFDYTISDGSGQSSANVQLLIEKLGIFPNVDFAGLLVREGLIFKPNGDGKIILDDQRDSSGSLVSSVKAGSRAVFDNLIGLYEVVDDQGGIDADGDGEVDFMPGDAGYAHAALTSARVQDFSLRAGASLVTAQRVEQAIDVLVDGGKRYAPFVIANGGSLGVQGFIDAEESTDFNNAAVQIEDAVAYFGFVAANPDGASHLRSYGNGVYGFEDLPSNLGLSDQDFNDAVFALSLASP